MKRKNKRGQIWVETVIYTLIGLSIIGILLAVIQPKINAQKDKLVIEQMIEIMNQIDERMDITPGNVRTLDLKLTRGSLFIDGDKDEIYWVLDDSRHKFSELGEEIKLGTVGVLTEGVGPWKVTLTLNYTGLDIKYNGQDINREIEPTASLYEMSIENLGVKDEEDGEGEQIINVKVE